MSEIHDGRVHERVPLDRITPGPNVRTEFGDLEGLAASIREHGVLTPLLLRRLNGDDAYELVAGARRHRAAVMAGVADLPAQVETPEALDTVADVRRVAEQLAENGHRLDLAPSERMGGVQQLLEVGLTDEQVAVQIVSEPQQVAAMRRILDLPTEVRALIEGAALDLEEAAELGACDDDEIVATAVDLLGRGYSASAALQDADDTVTRRRVAPNRRAPSSPARACPRCHPPSSARSRRQQGAGAGYWVRQHPHPGIEAPAPGVPRRVPQPLGADPQRSDRLRLHRCDAARRGCGRRRAGESVEAVRGREARARRPPGAEGGASAPRVPTRHGSRHAASATW